MEIDATWHISMFRSCRLAILTLRQIIDSNNTQSRKQNTDVPLRAAINSAIISILSSISRHFRDSAERDFATGMASIESIVRTNVCMGKLGELMRVEPNQFSDPENPVIALRRFPRRS